MYNLNKVFVCGHACFPRASSLWHLKACNFLFVSDNYSPNRIGNYDIIGVRIGGKCCCTGLSTWACIKWSLLRFYPLLGPRIEQAILVNIFSVWKSTVYSEVKTKHVETPSDFEICLELSHLVVNCICCTWSLCGLFHSGLSSVLISFWLTTLKPGIQVVWVEFCFNTG